MFLTSKVASVKGTWTLRDRNNDLKPLVLKPMRFPVHAENVTLLIKISSILKKLNNNKTRDIALMLI